MIHIMGDLETFGTGNNALPVSLGAVKFDGDRIIERFHVGIDPVDAERFGLKIDAGTIMWWFDAERDEARKQWLALPKVDLIAALDGFATWVEETPKADRGSFWGNGATFDNIILCSAYAAAGLTYPFYFTRDACYRTMKNLAPDIELVRVGTHPNAADDAESQAVHLQDICRARGIVL